MERDTPPDASRIASGCMTAVGTITIVLATLTGIAGGIWYLLERIFGG